jgi:hypothetical protein
MIISPKVLHLFIVNLVYNNESWIQNVINTLILGIKQKKNVTEVSSQIKFRRFLYPKTRYHSKKKFLNYNFVTNCII